MKKLFFIFLLWPIEIFCQVPVIGFSEYETIGMQIGGANNGKVYFIQGNAVFVPNSVGAINISGGAHNYAYRDSSNHIRTGGSTNSNGQAGIGTFSGTAYGDTKIFTDSAGNDFQADTVISSGDIGGANMWAIKHDGTLWAWGHLGGGLGGERPSGNHPSPIQITLPVGITAKYVAANVGMLMLGSDSNAYTLGGGGNGFATAYINPQGTNSPDTAHWYKVPLPAKVRKVTGGYYWSVVELYNGQIWGWSAYAGYLAIGDPNNTSSSSPVAVTSPIRIDTALGFTGPLIDLQMNSVAVYYITADSVMHVHGDASNGNIGDGTHLNMATYMNGSTPQPYAWNLSFNPAQLLVRKPRVFAPGIHFQKIYTSTALGYGVYGLTGNNQLIYGGRNKGGVAGDGVVSCETNGLVAATYPNSWDDSTCILSNPFTATIKHTTSPLCISNPSATYCNLGTCTYSSAALPTSVISAPSTVSVSQTFTLDGTGSTAAIGYFINGWYWKHLSGPNAVVPNPAFSKTPITNNIAGTDVYQLQIMDNQYQTATITKTIITGSTGANNFYFSAAGSDANACTLASPCQTIIKANSLSHSAGDSVYFNRGDVFYGTLIANTSGVYYGDYGTGAKPMITALSTLSGWISDGGGIYHALCSGCNVNTNVLLMNGIQQPQARYPNTGYRTYTSFSGSTSITDPILAASPNWTGGYVVIRNNRSNVSTNVITNHSGTTITYTSATGLTSNNNFGYFIIKDSLALDTLGEWWYSIPSGNMKVFFGGNAPVSYTVQTTTKDTLIYIPNGLRNITFNNLDLKGAGIFGYYIGKDTNVVVKNNTIRFAGGVGYWNQGCDSCQLINSSIQNCNSMGIGDDASGKYCYYGSDTILNIGLAGQGFYLQNFNYTGAFINDSFSTIELSKFHNCIGNGMAVYDWASVNNNAIDSTNSLTDDGAGIYAKGYINPSKIKRIFKNIVGDPVGALAGTNSSIKFAYCIYADQNNSNVYIDSNTVYNSPYGGIYFHNSANCFAIGNTGYNNLYGLVVQGDNGTYPINNLMIKRNIFGTTGTGQFMYRFDQYNGVHYNQTIGTIDSNRYAYFQYGPTVFLNSIVNQTFKQWTDSVVDMYSVTFPAPAIFLYNNSNAPKSFSLPGNFVDVNNNPYFQNAIVPPWQSLILIKANVAGTFKRKILLHP